MKRDVASTRNLIELYKLERDRLSGELVGGDLRTALALVSCLASLANLFEELDDLRSREDEQEESKPSILRAG